MSESPGLTFISTRRALGSSATTVYDSGLEVQQSGNPEVKSKGPCVGHPNSNTGAHTNTHQHVSGCDRGGTAARCALGGQGVRGHSLVRTGMVMDVRLKARRMGGGVEELSGELCGSRDCLFELTV